ncbi:MAG: shikimate kinase [Bacteroidales bacterium]|nr:shikimate kinase [Bacteroidales bacterium]
MVITDRPIVLMGMMGCGKSSLGKALAHHLKRLFIDLDKSIESITGQSIPLIFSQSGESYFRQVESLALQEAVHTPDCVIAIGGGTPCFGDNLKLILDNTFSIYLKVSEETLIRRIIQSKTVRPLAEGKNPDDLRQLVIQQLQEREPYYLKADSVIESDQITLEVLVTTLEIKMKPG